MPACPIEGQSNGIERGVNRTNLAWEPNWRAVIDDIVAHHVTSIRLTLTQPIERAADIAAYADRRGMRVLMNVPLSLIDYYDPAVVPRPGNDKIRSIRRLSDLDMDRYKKVLGQFLAELDYRSGHLATMEVGNEINWADFNGDLPVGYPGRIFDEQLLDQLAEYDRIVDGFGKYKLALETSRMLLHSSLAGKFTVLVTAGLYEPSAWTPGSGGSALTLAATKVLFDRLGITQAADALAVHAYPPSEMEAAAFSSILNTLHATTQICGARGVGKPCFITEWGIANSTPTACHDDSRRLGGFRLFERALSCLDRERDIRGALGTKVPDFPYGGAGTRSVVVQFSPIRRWNDGLRGHD